MSKKSPAARARDRARRQQRDSRADFGKDPSRRDDRGPRLVESRSHSRRLPWLAGDWFHVVGPILAALLMLIFVYLVIFRHLLWYGFFDISDITIYRDYAQQMAQGLRPYVDFRIEYPPLAVPLFTLPEIGADLADQMQYANWFAAEMLFVTAVAGAVTAATASSLWRDRSHPYLTGAAFAAGVAATGAIIANRYDATVALVLAITLLCLARRWFTAAALVIGLGFALKLTPAILLPLVLILCTTKRSRLVAGAFFLLGAVTPWAPYAFSGHGIKGLEYVFTYHLRRPLQIESVLATPFWIGHLLHRTWVEIGSAYGSQFIAAHGSDLVARLSGIVMIVALGAIYWILWRRRESLRQDPRLVPLAVFALILAFVVAGKVLSPQYFIWTLPVVALVVVERPTLGAFMLAVLVLTQVEFPNNYWSFVYMQDRGVAIVVARNLVLVATFALAVRELLRLPPNDRRRPGTV